MANAKKMKHMDEITRVSPTYSDTKSNWQIQPLYDDNDHKQHQSAVSSSSRKEQQRARRPRSSPQHYQQRVKPPGNRRLDYEHASSYRDDQKQIEAVPGGAKLTPESLNSRGNNRNSAEQLLKCRINDSPHSISPRKQRLKSTNRNTIHSYHMVETPNHNRKSRNHNDETPEKEYRDSLIMYGDDAGSQMTGWSQQDLLRKKRSQSPNRRKKYEKKYGSPTRKFKKKSLILNLPKSLVSSSPPGYIRGADEQTPNSRRRPPANRRNNRGGLPNSNSISTRPFPSKESSSANIRSIQYQESSPQQQRQWKSPDILYGEGETQEVDAQLNRHKTQSKPVNFRSRGQQLYTNHHYHHQNNDDDTCTTQSSFPLLSTKVAQYKNKNYVSEDGSQSSWVIGSSVRLRKGSQVRWKTDIDNDTSSAESSTLLKMMRMNNYDIDSMESKLTMSNYGEASAVSPNRHNSVDNDQDIVDTLSSSMMTMGKDNFPTDESATQSEGDYLQDDQSPTSVMYVHRGSDNSNSYKKQNGATDSFVTPPPGARRVSVRGGYQPRSILRSGAKQEESEFPPDESKKVRIACTMPAIDELDDTQISANEPNPRSLGFVGEEEDEISPNPAVIPQNELDSSFEGVESELPLDNVGAYYNNMTFIESVAAIVIQTAIRRYLAILTRQHLWREKAEVVAERSATTKEVTGETEEVFESMAFKMFDLAAIQIQSLFRGWFVRDSLQVDSFCAIIIQRAVRGWLCRLDYEFDRFRVVMIQSFWRRHLAINIAASRLISILAIQSFYKKYREEKAQRTRPPLNIEISPSRGKVKGTANFRRNSAATIIQAKWRAYYTQDAYLSVLYDIIIAQSVVRRWIARSLLLPFLLSSRDNIEKTLATGDNKNRARSHDTNRNDFRAVLVRQQQHILHKKNYNQGTNEGNYKFSNQQQLSGNTNQSEVGEKPMRQQWDSQQQVGDIGGQMKDNSSLGLSDAARGANAELGQKNMFNVWKNRELQRISFGSGKASEVSKVPLDTECDQSEDMVKENLGNRGKYQQAHHSDGNFLHDKKVRMVSEYYLEKPNSEQSIGREQGIENNIEIGGDYFVPPDKVDHGTITYYANGTSSGVGKCPDDQQSVKARSSALSFWKAREVQTSFQHKASEPPEDEPEENSQALEGASHQELRRDLASPLEKTSLAKGGSALNIWKVREEQNPTRVGPICMTTQKIR